MLSLPLSSVSAFPSLSVLMHSETPSRVIVQYGISLAESQYRLARSGLPCKGFFGGARKSQNLCLLLPDALPSHSFGSGFIIVWLETLPEKGGAG